MQIIYPPLVEESFAYWGGTDSQEKGAVYQQMVAKGIITETGEPTMEALEQGWVKAYDEAENLSFADFLILYPVFQKMDPTVFQLIEGFWEIPVSLKEQLECQLKAGLFDYDAVVQLTEYLAER